MLPHPHRSRSRQSTSSTTPDLDSLHSWSRSMVPRNSGGGTASSATSIWSDGDDGATVLPSSEEGVWGGASSSKLPQTYGGPNRRVEERREDGVRNEGRQRGISPIEQPLIELDSDYESHPTLQRKSTSEKIKPSEELRRLLRQMEDEVKSSTPADPFSNPASPIKRPNSLPPQSQSPFTRVERIPRSPPLPSSNARRGHWREGRRIGVYPPATAREESSPERNVGSGDGEEEVESPPTPPLRITNPYLHTSRKTSDPISQSKQRISSRAAVLQNSASRSPPPEQPSSHSPSPLETFIATHPVPADPSSSRSPPSFRSSTSRKGKERATPSPISSSRPTTSIRHRLPPSSFSSSDENTPHRPIPTLPRRTPRRHSVEIAPDDSEVFAQDLERREEVELDLDEEEEDGIGRPWASETGSDEVREESREGPPISPNRSREDSSRLSNLLSIDRSRRKELSVDISLPYLPGPEEEEDDGDEEMDRRRAGLFRSGSRGSTLPRPQVAVDHTSSPKVPRRSPLTTSVTRDHDISDRSNLSVPPSDNHTPPFQYASSPIRVGMTLTPPTLSTPPPKIQFSETTTSATPHPPGFLALTPARSVRFSPLRKTDQDWSESQLSASSTGESSMHRLKVSPARKPHLPSPTIIKQDEADTSFTGRLGRFLLPTPSTTLADASGDLDRARRMTEEASKRVEESHKAWSEALGQLGRQASQAGRKGVKWGSWGWWICVEVTLIWCVFRLTLEYTAFRNPHANTFQTLNLSPHALSTRIPGAISAFVIPRESANFFDVLERYEVWKRLERVMAVGAKSGFGEGVAESRVRMVGGVPS